ncbi:MAG: CbiX/SirB N-terminal domain-containing protein [Acidobacteria bacterium]|nr:CbiX/SirB N-terminal domain-containing protein [Acidobacteriota bacterium]
MTCAICKGRKGKRFCPALGSEICTQCCGSEREESIDCPLDCPYLVESRQHERLAGISPENFPYKEIKISDTYLREREELLNAAARSVLTGAFNTRGATDHDAREALDALARTYKSLESGVYYETIPPSPVAQALVRQMQELLKQFREEETKQAGMVRTRDADVLGIPVREVARAAADRCGFQLWSEAFLEGGRPDLAGAVATLIAAGARRILVIPYFLTLRLHLQRDLPRLVAEVSRGHEGVNIICGDPLDGHPALVDILAERAKEARRKL